MSATITPRYNNMHTHVEPQNCQCTRFSKQAPIKFTRSDVKAHGELSTSTTTNNNPIPVGESVHSNQDAIVFITTKTNFTTEPNELHIQNGIQQSAAETAWTTEPLGNNWKQNVRNRPQKRLIIVTSACAKKQTYIHCQPCLQLVDSGICMGRRFECMRPQAMHRQPATNCRKTSIRLAMAVRWYPKQAPRGSYNHPLKQLGSGKQPGSSYGPYGLKGSKARGTFVPPKPVRQTPSRVRLWRPCSRSTIPHSSICPLVQNTGNNQNRALSGLKSEATSIRRKEKRIDQLTLTDPLWTH